jgi:hypothetical protein
MTWDDTQAEFIEEPTYQLMGEAVDTGFMPITPFMLEPKEKQAILDWVRAGAPFNPKRCP